MVEVHAEQNVWVVHGGPHCLVATLKRMQDILLFLPEMRVKQTICKMTQHSEA